MMRSSASLLPSAIVPTLRTLRRSFKKSRKGCKACKSRRVKCDEAHPICGPCSRRFPDSKDCDYDFFIEFPVKVKETSKSLSKAHLPRQILHPSPTIHLPGTVGQSRVLELRLMHHYTTNTCSQLPDGEIATGKSAWSIELPQLAFQSELVLNALLGISALHLGALVPDDPTLSHAAKFYFDKALRSHRITLSNVEKDTAEAVLATAIVICHHTWISGHSPSDEPYEIPLQTYYMARSIQALFDHMWPWLSESSYLWYIDRKQISDLTGDLLPSPWMTNLREDLTRLSASFEDGNTPSKDKSTYERATEELSSMCHAISSCLGQHNIQKRVATMPIRLPGRFLELVEIKDPRALCLLARNLALLKVIDPVWWLHGTGPSQTVAETAVDGIRRMLPTEWLWAMQWPMNVILGLIRP